MQPSIGILSVLQHDDDHAERPFGEQTPLFEAIHYAALAKGTQSFVVPPQPLTDETTQLSAFTFHNGKWVEAMVPFPTIIYNRMPTRALEQTPANKQVLTLLRKRTGGRIFNRIGFFSKLQIHTLLQKNLPNGLHLPWTQASESPEQILRQAAIWGEAWLKPDDGSRGRGVFRILREPFGFTIESSDHASNEQFQTLEAVEHLTALLPQSTTSYLIQQGIPRSEYRHRPYDIRVLLHKNGLGKFAVTHQFARLANHGQIVTNVTAGGEGLSLKNLMTPGEQNTLRTIALDCARRLATSLPGPLGELGLDLAFDKERNFWLIEANSKPRLKMDPADPFTSTIADKIVDYALYLLKNPPKRKRSP